MKYSVSDDCIKILHSDQKPVMCFNRKSGEIRDDSYKSEQEKAIKSDWKDFDLVIGTLNFVKGKVLFLCTKSEKVVDLIGKSVYRVLEYKNFWIKEGTNGNIHPDDSNYLALVKAYISSASLYFSFDLDLTHSVQAVLKNGTNFSSPNDEFHWNWHMSKDLENFKKFTAPLINGFVESFEENGRKATLISRRGCKREGKRYHCRGIDDSGNVANFVETEFIVESANTSGEKSLKTNVKSSISIRGSIPVYWQQIPNLSWKPNFDIDFSSKQAVEKTTKVLGKHFDKLEETYGRIVVINLVKSHGRERNLEKVFRYCLVDRKKKSPQGTTVCYVYFDYHKKADKISLVSEITEKLSEITSNMAFEANANLELKEISAEIVKPQTAAYRINCIDCLDRTNIIQTYFTERIFKNSFDLDLSDSPAFKQIWTKNGDAMGIQYATSGALHSGALKKGALKVYSKVMDGKKALTRYFVNNFRDGSTNDAINIVLGKYDCASMPSIFTPPSLLKTFGELNFGVVTFISAVTFALFHSVDGNKRLELNLNALWSVAASWAVGLYLGNMLIPEKSRTVDVDVKSVEKSKK